MLEKLLPLKLPPGLYKNGTKYQAKGRWFDSNLVRFYEGAIRPIQGWRVASDSDGNPMSALEGTPRAALAWRSAAGDALLAVGTNSHLYVIKAGVTYDITPTDFVSGNADAGGGDYGLGLYGANLYGEGKAPLAATLTEADTWQLDAFGDVLVACCTKGGRIYVWTGDTGSAAVVAGGSSPEPNRGVVITPERFVVALGAGDGTDIDVRKVQWASQATTDTWAPLDTNTAGDFTLSTNGRVMCGRRTKAQTLIWTDTDMHSMNYIGGTLVYSFKQEGDNCGIISPQAVAVVDTAAIWMGRNNFYMYDGFVKPVPCDVHDHVFDDFNIAAASKVFACPVSEFSEIWWFYPSAGSTENDRYVVFNYRENHWAVGTLARTAAIDRGALPSPVMFDGNGTVYQHEQSAGDRVVPEPDVFDDTLEDTEGTALEDHTGLSWSKELGDALDFDSANRLVLSGIDTPVYVVSDDVGSDDYAVSITAKLTSVAGADFGGVGARMQGTTAAGYYFGIATDDAVFRLMGLDASGADLFTPIDVDIPSDLLGVDVVLTLRVHGTTLTGFVDGIAMCSATDATYASGKAGIYGGGSTPADTVVTDTFVDTDGTSLEDHTPTTADFTWLPVTSGDGADSLEIVNNGLVMDDAYQNGAFYEYQADGVNGADSGEFTLVKDDSNLGLNAALTLRATTAPITAADGYSVRFTPLFGPTHVVMSLWKNGTQLGSDYDAGASTWPGAGTFLVGLRIEDNATAGHKNIIVSLDGTDIITYDDATPLTGLLCGVGLQNGSLAADGRHLSRVSFAPAPSNLLLSGPFTVTGFSSQAVQALESNGGATQNANGSITLKPFLESGPIELGDGDQVMRVQRIVPDEKNLGDVKARFYTSLFPTAAETEHGPYTLAEPTPVRFTARQVRMRLEEANAGADWRIGLTRLGVIPGGRR